MSGRGGIEYHMLVFLPSLLDDLRHLFQNRGFLHAGGILRQRDMLVYLTMQLNRHQAMQGACHFAHVFLHGRFRIDFEAVEIRREPHRPGTDLAIEQMAEVMGRVGGNEQRAPALVGESQCRRRGNGGLADAALAAEEKNRSGTREI